ncbi:LOW QUALITY PROTEIN: Transposase, partial [Phytophthora megakarya]
MYFWKQVVVETNQYAAIKKVRITSLFTVDELMIFLGIMFYIPLAEKGEYSNYWGPQTEAAIFGRSLTRLDSIISLNRFKLLRRCLSFRADPGETLQRDPAARIRPLLYLLKCTGGRYVEVSRNLTLDEWHAGHAKDAILLYSIHKSRVEICCATTWIALNYRLHCNNSDIADRLQDLATQAEIQQIREEFEKISQVRKHVLEVVRPYFHTRRIINMDKYYTSVQLLLELRLKEPFEVPASIIHDTLFWSRIQRLEEISSSLSQWIITCLQCPVTDYCHTHSVCLCRGMHDYVERPFICTQSTWTCWDKFHKFYLPNGLFTDKGNVNRSVEYLALTSNYETFWFPRSEIMPSYGALVTMFEQAERKKK